MKKTKMIALTLVVAIMMIGAGYAAWTDFTQVEGTVETGTMDVQVKDARINTPKFTTGSVQEIDGNTIKFNAKGLYPTVFNLNDRNTFGGLYFTIENEGSIPVKLDNVEFSQDNMSSEIWNHLGTAVSIYKCKITDMGFIDLTTKESLTGNSPIIGNLKDLGTIISNSDLKDTVLNPDETIIFGWEREEELESSIRYFLRDTALNDTQDDEIGFTLKINWKQANL